MVTSRARDRCWGLLRLCHLTARGSTPLMRDGRFGLRWSPLSSTSTAASRQPVREPSHWSGWSSEERANRTIRRAARGP